MFLAAWVFSHLLPILECPDGTQRREERAVGRLVAEWCAGPDGVLDGPQVSYYPNGVRVAILHYRNGVLDGPAEYSLNDRTIWRRDENRDGEAILEWHNPAVALLSREELTDRGAGSCGGVVAVVRSRRDRRSWSRKRSPRLPPASIVRLVDGGTATGRYDHGARFGEWLFRDARDNLIKRASFSSGALSWSYREWYSDGTPKTEGQYLGGRKWGTWKFWTTDGTVKEAHYDDP